MSANHPIPIAVTVMPLAQVKPDPTNPKKHSKRQIQKLAAAYGEFGYLSPLVVDERSVIIAGHGRWLAAERLGLSDVPVIVLRGLSNDQKKALRIADNRIAEDGSWNPELLANELRDLIAADFDTELTGFDAIEIDRILAPPAIAGAEDDIPEVPATATTQLGDLWQCGDHRIFCGDSRDPASFEALMQGQRADLIFTDVPYNIPIPGMVSGAGAKTHANFAMASGEMSAAEFSDFLIQVMGLGREFSRDGSLHYHCIDWRHIADMVVAGRQVFDTLLNICVWAKNNGGMGTFYRSQHEMVAVFKNGKASHTNNVQLGRLGRNRSNLWQYPGASSFSVTRKADLADHPTVKPVALVADAIRDASIPGDLILDPFGGSGTTLLAAQETKRHARLIEIDPRYVDVTLRRFQRATGTKPVLQRNFSEVTAELEESDNVWR
jgi:DNA modification methylase